MTTIAIHRHVLAYDAEVMEHLDARQVCFRDRPPDVHSYGSYVVKDDRVRFHFGQYIEESRLIGWMGQVLDVPDQFPQRAVLLAERICTRKRTIVTVDSAPGRRLIIADRA